MRTQASSSNDDATQRLAEKLKLIRGQHQGSPEERSRQALQEALREELGTLSEEDAGRRLDHLREHFLGEAREREEQFETLRTEVNRLQSEADTLRASRDSFEKQLRDQSLQKAQTGSNDTLQKIRDGLNDITSSKPVTPESMGLTESEGRLFQLIKELLEFAFRIELFIQGLLEEAGAARSDTHMMKMRNKMVRDRFRACLENKTGSVRALKESLEKNSRFLVDFNAAYQTAIKQGVPLLLTELDPEPILEECKGRLSTDWDGFHRKVSTRHMDLVNLDAADRWERFFLDAFRAKLAESWGTEGEKA